MKPVITAYGLWLLYGCETVRISATCFIHVAIRGRCSQMGRPETLVAIEPNSPRTSGGASGLGSNMSMWLGPPNRSIKITDLIRGLCLTD